jgi:hypothetical protein
MFESEVPHMERSSADLRSDRAIVGLALASIYLVAALWLGGAAAFPSLALPFLATAAAAMWTLSGRHAPLGLIEAGWPLLLWPFLYMGAVQVVEHVPWTFDPQLARLDRALLGPISWRLGGPAEELANLVYVSYYVGIPAGFFWLWLTHRRKEAAAYTTAILTAFLACAALWIVVPAGGPHPDGAPDGAPFGPFTALMRLVYDANPHHVAALPSSHVALATAATIVAVRSGAPRIGLVWPLAIGWATIFGEYHFALDTPPALVVGAVSASFAMRQRAGTVGWLPAAVIRER